MIRGMSKLFLASAGALIVVIVIGFMWIFGVGFMSQTTAPWRGETEKKERVEGSGNYRIAAYDHFFDLCSSVQTKEASIENLRAELKADPPPSEQRKTVIQASMSALMNSRAEAINEYNADARKEYTRGQFRDSDLPFQLRMKELNTTCTSDSTSPSGP